MDTTTTVAPQRLESFSNNSSGSDQAFIVRPDTVQKDAEPEIVEEKEESPDTHVESENPIPDFISFFRAKLKDPQQYLFCFSCCSLWIAAHIALLFLFMLILSYIFDIFELFKAGDHALGVLLLLLITVQFVCSLMAWRALNCCDTQWIRNQYYMLCVLWIPILNLIAALVSDEIAAVVFVECVLGIGLQLYCLLVFRRVYLWAQYFQKGGKYRKDMMRPKSIQSKQVQKGTK